MPSEATEYANAWTTFANVEKSWAYVQDQLPSTHPIAADIVDLDAVEVNFDGITYAKGASVLKQLAAYVGSEFLAGLRDYFGEHAYGNATLDDLLGRAQTASGRDLDWGSHGWRPPGSTCCAPTSRWTLTAVHPVRGHQGGAARAPARRGRTGWRSGSMTTTAPDSWSGSTGRSSTSSATHGGAGTRRRSARHAGAGQRRRPDLLQVAAGRRLAGNGADRIGDIAESLPRTLVWSAVWEMTRDASCGPVTSWRWCAGCAAETEIGVVQRLLLQAQTALGSYADPGWACEQGWPPFADRLLELARDAEPGSDHQLAFVNALCSSVLQAPPHRGAGRRCWTTRPTRRGWPGLVVDTDLRWRIVTALASAGVIDADGPGRRSSTPSAARPDRRGSAARRGGVGGASELGSRSGLGPT